MNYNEKHRVIVLLIMFIFSNVIVSQIKKEESKLDSLMQIELDELIKGKQIVLIGENSHGDGLSVGTRFEIVKYLHEKHNFNNITFESGLFETNVLNKFIKSTDDSLEIKKMFRKTLMGVWSYSKEYQPMFQYLTSEIKKNKLNLNGIDCQINNRISASVKTELEDYLTKKNIFKKIEHEEWYKGFAKILNKLILDKGNHKVRPKRKDELNYTNAIDSINYFITKYDNSQEGKLWIQILTGYKKFSSLEFHFSVLKILMDFSKTSLRDSIMSENINWKYSFDSTKTIIWAHSGHILRYNPAIPKYKSITYYLKKYKLKTFVIHTSAGTGDAAPPFVLNKKLEILPPKKNSYEHKILQNTKGVQLLSIEKLKLYSDKNVNNLRITNYKSCIVKNPKNCFDALLFFPIMKSATMIDGGWEEIFENLKK